MRKFWQKNDIITIIISIYVCFGKNEKQHKPHLHLIALASISVRGDNVETFFYKHQLEITRILIQKNARLRSLQMTNIDNHGF